MSFLGYKGWREPEPGEKIDGMPVVFVGGCHFIVCDGEWHHQYNGPALAWKNKMPCAAWEGGCPAKKNPPGPDDCLCVFPDDRPRPACPHDIRGPDGAMGTVGIP